MMLPNFACVGVRDTDTMLLWLALACDSLLVPHNAAHTQRLATAAAQLSGSTSQVQIKLYTMVKRSGTV